MFGVDAEFFHHFGAGRAQSEAMETDDFSVQTDVLIPSIGNAGFDGDPFTTGSRKNFFAILFRFAIETLEAGH